MALELYLVRHGKTVFNATGRLQGWSDSPLLPESRTAAYELGRALAAQVSFDAAFSSTSPRASETAQLILQGCGQSNLPLTALPELREYCFGGLEGELAAKVHQMIAADRGFADVESWLAAYRHAPRHLLAESVSKLDPLQIAETEEQFTGRLKAGLQLLTEKSPCHSKVLLVCHGMSISVILKNIDWQSTPYKSVENTTVSRLIFQNDKWKILSIGEVIQ